ncbi:unnamed protein product [Blepharisma stoltei]|uniref:Uncharacterized protein n=1 Tax=Blepharisma stoltei TaxID=1481888 RepID=A0AAU9KA50_9CILI|nr:unnamed protein product [Blepharisma stoltei]
MMLIHLDSVDASEQIQESEHDTTLSQYSEWSTESLTKVEETKEISIGTTISECDTEEFHSYLISGL